MRAVVVLASSTLDETMPSKDVIRKVQQQARAGLGAMISGAFSFTTPIGRATKDNKNLFRIRLDGQDMLWIPEHATKMQTRLMVCAHMKDAGHRGVMVTLQQLQGRCCWFRVGAHVTENVKQCLHYMDSKTGEKIPRPLGETVYGTKPGGFFILTTCTSETVAPWLRIDWMR